MFNDIVFFETYRSPFFLGEQGSFRDASMATQKTYMQETTAAGTGAAFDYQFYYFLYRLLNMKKGQSIGLEIKDDVHSDLDNDVQLLFQLKHTIQKQADGHAIALSELDADLWKTLHNWARVICDPRDGRQCEAAQSAFVKNTEFHLVSNKSVSRSNSLARHIITYGEDPTCENLHAVLKRVDELSLATKDASIKIYIQSIQALEPGVKREFFKRVFFQLAESEIIQKVKDSLEEKFVDPAQIDSVYGRLSTLIRDDNYISILEGKLTTISFDDFNSRYRKVISPFLNRRLSALWFEPALPPDILNQRFIKQLIVIEDLCEDDSESITGLSTHKVRMARSLEQWVQSGEVVSDEVATLNNDVRLRWRNKHRKAFRDCDEAGINKVAQQIVDALRDERFRLGDDELDTEQSNGELYILSEHNVIGWHRDWETL